jgi:SAM-dependent methyltransferase
MPHNASLPEEPVFFSDPAAFAVQEQRYLRVRRLEGRVLGDAELRRLPAVPTGDPLAREWRWRARALGRLVAHLRRKTVPLRILDLGCGNGWMANRLAAQPHWALLAVDLNEAELRQGARLFGRGNLRFVYADVFGENAAGQTFRQAFGQFDVVLLAASVQYFPDLGRLVAHLRGLLRPGGEIHLLDSHFYPDAAACQAARQRSADYYARLGVPEMADFYHHHALPDIQALGGRSLNRHWWTRLQQKMRWLSLLEWLVVESNDELLMMNDE